MFPDGTFGISNDEGLIHHLIDRKAGEAIEAGDATTTAGQPRRSAAVPVPRPPAPGPGRGPAVRRRPRGSSEAPHGRCRGRTKTRTAGTSRSSERLLGAIESAGAGLVVTRRPRRPPRGRDLRSRGSSRRSSGVRGEPDADGRRPRSRAREHAGRGFARPRSRGGLPAPGPVGPRGRPAPAGQHRDGRERDLPGPGPADAGPARTRPRGPRRGRRPS